MSESAAHKRLVAIGTLVVLSAIPLGFWSPFAAVGAFVVGLIVFVVGRLL